MKLLLFLVASFFSAVTPALANPACAVCTVAAVALVSWWFARLQLCAPVLPDLSGL